MELEGTFWGNFLGELFEGTFLGNVFGELFGELFLGTFWGTFLENFFEELFGGTLLGEPCGGRCRGNLGRFPQMSGEPWEVPPILFLTDFLRDVGGTFGDVGDISRGCRGNLGRSWKFFLRIS